MYLNGVGFGHVTLLFVTFNFMCCVNWFPALSLSFEIKKRGVIIFWALVHRSSRDPAGSWLFSSTCQTTCLHARKNLAIHFQLEDKMIAFSGLSLQSFVQLELFFLLAYFGESNLYLTLAQYCSTSGIVLPKMPLGTNVKVSNCKDGDTLTSFVGF